MTCLDSQSVRPENPTLITFWKRFSKGRFCHSPLFRRAQWVSICPVWRHPAGRVQTPVRKAGYHTFRRIVHRSAEAAGLEINVTPHTFRRSCTTELIRGGANLYHVKELLGHENLETLKHYTKLTIEDLKATHARCHPREQAGDG